MRRFGFENEYGTSIEFGIRFLEFPVFDCGEEIIESKSIPGRAGALSIRTGRYTDSSITNNIEFTCEAVEDYEAKLEGIKKWILQSGKVSYSDSQDKYYVVKKVEFGSIKRKYGTIGNINFTFICEPFAYFKEGDFEIDVVGEKLLINGSACAQPIYKISGNGACTISVNGKSMAANVSGNITIDTERMLAYQDDGTLQNTAVSGNYEDLYLQEDENTITATGGFSVKVIPKWRCL